MTDTPERLWVQPENRTPVDEDPRLAGPDDVEYVRADLYEQAVKRAEAAEAELEQVKRERDDYKRKWEQACAMGRLQHEAAERLTGARVVTDAMVEEAIEAGGFSNSPYTVQHMRYALEAIIPALAEPAGEAEPVAWRWKPKDSAAWIYDPKHEWLEAQSRDEIDAEPLFTRPSEQAVTEAMKAAADQLEKIAFNIPAPNPYTPQLVTLANGMRDFVLKAAMEAGR